MNKEGLTIHEKCQYLHWVSETVVRVRNGENNPKMLEYDSREGDSGQFAPAEMNDLDSVLAYVTEENCIVYGRMSTFVFAMGQDFFYAEQIYPKI